MSRSSRRSPLWFPAFGGDAGERWPQKPSAGMARSRLVIVAAAVVALLLGLVPWYVAARSRSQAAAALSKIEGIKLKYTPAFFDDPNMMPVVPTTPSDVGYFLWRGIDSITWEPLAPPDEAQIVAFWQGVRALPNLQQIKAPIRPKCLSPAMASASTLKSLELDGNLGPADLDALSQCKELRTLHFGLEDDASKEMKRLKALPRLESFQCRGPFGDDACELFRGTPHLRSIVFLGTPPSGKAFASAIADLDSLRRLRMPGCKDADEVCRALKECELEYLDLSDSDVTDEGIGNLHPETDDDSTFVFKNTAITPASLMRLCSVGEVQVNAESCPKVTEADAEQIHSKFPNVKIMTSKR